MTKNFERYHPDLEKLHHGFQTNPCFICAIVNKEISSPAHIIFENDDAIVFLDKYPRQYGYTLVAPKKHLEQVTRDFDLKDYLELQKLVYFVSEAVREEVGAERMYIFTFGSNQGNAHVHWHVVPLPPGTPYKEQQGEAISWRKGVLKIPDEEMLDLAKRIGQRLKHLLRREI